VHKFSSWAAFEAEFISHFCPQSEQQTALQALSGKKWYQGKNLIDDYIDCFTELVEIAEADDHKLLVIHFREGLAPDPQNKVATLTGNSAPKFDDLDTWYTAARHVASVEDNNKIFEANNRASSCHQLIKPTVEFSKAFNSFCPIGIPSRPAFSGVNPPKPAFQGFCPQAAPFVPAASKEGPVSMDVDRTRGAPKVKTCHRCGSPDHFVAGCPCALDIRFMTLGEK